MPPMTRQAFLANYPPDIQRLVDQLAALVSAVAPTATESVKLGWACVAFTHPDVGYFCGLFPKDDRVKVGFEFGVLLPDPDYLLTGTGTQLRYFDIVIDAPLPEKSLAVFIEQAIALPPGAAARRAMVRDSNPPSWRPGHSDKRH
ncbi:MAG: DUF1801 domain-containing protein [Chloroflexi bacterium]|nr:DUF1801 domain-containing protein [Chloroflexota bacterium]